MSLGMLDSGRLHSGSLNTSSLNTPIEGPRASPYLKLSTLASPQYHAQYHAQQLVGEDEVGDRLDAFSSQPTGSGHDQDMIPIFATGFKGAATQKPVGPDPMLRLRPNGSRPNELRPNELRQRRARYALNDNLLTRDADRPLVDPLPVGDALTSDDQHQAQRLFQSTPIGSNTQRTFNSRQSRNAKDRTDPLTGFIVADAHFGWDDAGQPANETIRDRMRHINQRFPNLDIFWDAGDAHHNADDNERSDWLTYLAGEIPQTPLYFTAGNHEVDNYSGPNDPEERAQQLGSVSVRPYYSVDIKNIHIISLPELINVNYLSAESLAWLRLDLHLNQDKTVIIISHNALSGTTSTDEGSIYREVANSDAMFDLMRQYSNIRAWVHGHNHNYKVVKQDDTLFVSAGRMGGFNGDKNTDLRLDDDNLGGMYFKVDQNTLTIRAYNASKQQFMDKLGYPGLSKTLRFKTSLDADAPARLSYGYGLARDGQRIPGYNHHLNASQRELFISGSQDAVFNDNAQLTSFQEEEIRGQLLNAIHVSPQDGYKWLDPTIRLLPQPSGKSTTVNLTSGSRTRWTYYRAAPKRKYMAVLKLDAVEGDQQVRLQARVRDSDGNIVKTLRAKSWQLTDDPQTLRYPFKVPALRNYPSIYTDLTSDRQLQLSVEAKFRDMDHPVILKAFKVRLKGGKKATENPALIIHSDPNGAQAGSPNSAKNSHTYQHNGLLGSDDYAHFDLPTRTPQRSVFEASAQGTGLLTFLVRETGLRWQVRNGTATRQNGSLLIGPKRNQFGSNQEILITPMGTRSRPYLNRLTNVEQARLSYGGPNDSADMEIELLEVTGPEGRLTVVARKKPRRVKGATRWTFKNGLLEIVAIDDALVTIDF